MRVNKKEPFWALFADKSLTTSANVLSIAMGSTQKVLPIAMKFTKLYGGLYWPLIVIKYWGEYLWHYHVVLFKCAESLSTSLRERHVYLTFVVFVDAATH